MALPPFDEHGNLPAGRHEAVVDDVVERLVGASRLCGERWEDYFGHDRDGRERGFVVVPG